MGLFDELMKNAGKRGLAMSEAYDKQKKDKEEFAAKTASEAARYTAQYAAVGSRADERYVEKSDNAMDRALANPSSLDSTAAALAEQHSTATKRPKYTKYGTKTEAVDASMGGSPLAGIGDRIKNVYTTKLQDSKGTGKSVAQIQQEAVSEVMTPELVQASYEHKAKADSSITNLFGLFGDDSGVKAANGKVLGMVGYDTWKANIKRANAKELAERDAGIGLLSTDKKQIRQDILNASLGAAGSLVAGGVALAIPSGGTSLAPTTAGAAVLVGGALLRGALMAGTGRIASAVSRAYEGTDFATFHKGDAQERGFGATVGAVALAAGAKGSGFKVMAGLGAVGAAAGAASPALAVDFLGWTGAQAIADKGGELALKRFANLGSRSEASLNALAHDPTGAKVVAKFRDDKALAEASEAVTFENLRVATEKALYEAEFARMEKGQALANVLERRKQSMMPNEVAGTVSKDLREVDGDVVSLAAELQQERRMATPGGPNAFSLEAATPKVVKGKGKSKVTGAAAKVVDQQEELEKVHFNNFLEEMKEAGEVVKRQDDITKGVYTKLFATANRPTDLSDGLSKLSWDGLNKVIGEGAEAGWKVLSIGERVQIVNGAENAAHAALVRGAGTAAGADRLASLTSKLSKAVKTGMKSAPEDLAKELQKVVESSGSPYSKGGVVDLQTLQVDLADHGFESVQQLAFTVAKGQPKVNVKKLTAFEEAATALRNGFGSNLVKLGVGGVAASSAAGLYDPSDSHAGVFDAVFKAGGKVFNSAAQHTPALTKFPETLTMRGKGLDSNLYKELKRWGGISPDEFNYLGLGDMPQGSKISKNELSAIIEMRSPDVKTVHLGAHSALEESTVGSAKFYNYAAIKPSVHRLLGDVSRPAGNGPVESFVEVSNVPKSRGILKADEHYGEYPMQQTLVRYRWEEARGPSGKKEMWLNELQEPQRVREARDFAASTEATYNTSHGTTANRTPFKSLSVSARAEQITRATEYGAPHALAVRAIDIGVKDMLATAKKLGHERIYWSTGEQQKTLYANALRNIADTVEYNTVTKMFSVSKNGVAVKGYPKQLNPGQLAAYIGEGNVSKLLASPVGEVAANEAIWHKIGNVLINAADRDASSNLAWHTLDETFAPVSAQILKDVRDGASTLLHEFYKAYTLHDKVTTDTPHFIKSIMRDVVSQVSQGNVHVAESILGSLPRINPNLTIDAIMDYYKALPKAKSTAVKGTPGVSYPLVWVQKTPTRLQSTEGGYHILGTDNEALRLYNHDKSKLLHTGNMQKLISAANDHAKHGFTTHTLTDITFDANWPDALYGSFKSIGEFNFNAVIPSLLRKYGKGSFGVLPGKNEDKLLRNMIGKPLSESIFDLDDGALIAAKDTIVTPDLLVYLESKGLQADGAFENVVQSQPYMDIPKDMSTNFTLFSHPASLVGTAGIAATMAGTLLGNTTQPIPAGEEIKGKYLGDEMLAAAEMLGKKLEPLVSLLSPAEAHAGGYDAAVKLFGNLKTSQAAAVTLKDAGEGVAALKYAHDADLIFQELPCGAVSARGFRVGYLDTAPKGPAEMKAVVRRLTNVVPGQNLTTPYFSSQTLLKSANDGDRLLGNPAIQLAHGQSAVSHNTRQSFEVLDTIYKTNGIKISKSNSKAIETAMLPVQKAYDASATTLRANEAAAGHLRNELKYLTETSAKDAEFAANMAPAVAAKKAALEAAEGEIKAVRPAFNDAKADVEIYQRAMAMRFPEARLSLAVEDTADFAKRPWLRDLLSAKEKQATLQIQDVMAEYSERIITTMGKDSVITGGYVKHSRTFLPEQAKQLANLEAKLDKLGLNGKESLALTKLHERTLYSQQMIPDIGRNMADYVPDVEKRLMNADFWNKWSPFRNTTTVKNSPALKGMFDRIAESARPAEDTMLRRFSSNYAKVETIRLLAGLASAPAKHLFKVLGDVSQLGLLNTGSVMIDAASMGYRNFVRIQGQKLAKAGFITDDVAASLFTKQKDVDSFAAAIVNQRGMVDYLSDLEKTYGVGHRSTIDKILDPLTELAGMGIKVVETFDRTVSVLAAAKMAQKQGMTGQQAMYGIYDTILKNNFLSGQLNSAWAKDPNVRALMLFQNTPFKIWERRIANASIAGTDVKTALGVIKAQDLPAAKAELNGIRLWAAQASQAFKNGMLMDALNSSKDVFGNSVSGQFVREALGVGVVLGAGNMAGINLTGHLLHTPFVSTGYSGAPEVSMSPLVKAGLNTAIGKQPAGSEDWDADDHSKVADFFKHWYGTAGYSLMASKFGRISSGDIPDQYKDSKFKFLFAMPATDDK